MRVVRRVREEREESVVVGVGGLGLGRGDARIVARAQGLRLARQGGSFVVEF